MDIPVEIAAGSEKERILIECRELTPEIEEIRTGLLARQRCIAARQQDTVYKMPIGDVYYFEAVDERTFAYTKSAVYEVKSRLYEVENLFAGCGFLRCSKSVVLNVYHIESFSPALNGRFFAHMDNGEKLIVSRQYIAGFKRAVLGGKEA
jgi:DNA-binding LytR/AlgR family response regulator